LRGGRRWWLYIRSSFLEELKKQRVMPSAAEA
jgi:hypothetical protein